METTIGRLGNWFVVGMCLQHVLVLEVALKSGHFHIIIKVIDLYS